MTTTTAHVSADIWPDIARVPDGLRAQLGAPIARKLFLSAVRRLPLTLEMPGTAPEPNNGTTNKTATHPVMTIHYPDRFFARLAQSGLIGLGESYMAREWDAEDLAAVMGVFASQVSKLIPQPLQALRSLLIPRHPKSERNESANTKSNIARHYDLSNDLFASFLDPTRTYSSALFESLDAPSYATLEAAQQRKIDRLLDAAKVTAGSRVLEIGTGWGELALRAAARGATVFSVTLSEEQKELAERRVAEAGLSGQVTIQLMDYRQITGQFDAVLSVEMIEAVGLEFMPEYFRVIADSLVPGGRVGLQAITIGHERMLATRNSYTWVHKYIFPGGMIPSSELIGAEARAHGLIVENRLAFGQHYAETLRLWDEAFNRASERVDALGFDETFRRMWHFYLAYSRAGFASGYLDVQQFAMVKGGRA
ncbi:SAM-dependent methyltransferase [Haematomicrobium sanguinis]|uniref:SAM-dependent methyltransferase n=1 Tax=Haematomicrobium sanguinis TaxID=479106 RepID=UPI00047BC383|nr:cyclopropane-fatty-acyl-phospholipid synthase family protein [Haematomicrobium sanguinis]